MTQDSIAILSEMYPNEMWKKMYLWSDGCSAQYKSKTSFYFLDKYTLPIERNFFGSEHGKNECDGFTGTISVKYDNAVKSGEQVIMNACELKEFLCKTYMGDKTKIFKLIEKDDKDLEAIRLKFNNEQIQVLEGNCTRTLHQIKYDNKKDYLSIRPYACFCEKCKNNDFEQCHNKNFTGGKFLEKELKVKTIGHTEADLPHMSENENEENNVDNGDDTITVDQQEIEFTDLQVGNLIVVPVEDRRGNIFNFPAQITELENNEIIYIDYLKIKFDHPNVLYQCVSEREKNYIVPLKDIIMILPKPMEIRRDRFIFDKNIRF